MKKETVTLESIAHQLDYLNERMVVKDDLKSFATKDDLKRFATKDDLKPFATKKDIKKSETKVAGAIERLNSRLDRYREENVKFHKEIVGLHRKGLGYHLQSLDGIGKLNTKHDLFVERVSEAVH